LETSESLNSDLRDRIGLSHTLSSESGQECKADPEKKRMSEAGLGSKELCSNKASERSSQPSNLGEVELEVQKVSCEMSARTYESSESGGLPAE